MNTYRKVHPQTDETNATMKTPKGSNFLLIAVNDPDIAKKKTPIMSKIVTT